MCVSVQLMGGLGNQLFQMSACIGYAKKHDINYCIPKHTLNDSVWKPYHFDKINYCDDNDTIAIQKIWKEISHAYNEIPKFNRSVVLNGYFQSPLYFQDYRKEILELFGFDNLIIKKGFCSVHIRHGDYLKYPTKHPVVDINKYIFEAINIMIWKHQILDFIIFSDDIEWCKLNIPNKGVEPIMIHFKEQGDELDDLKSMAECEHNIIANSTFSYWGAWLNNNPNKIVITPDESNWFGVDNNQLDVSTLLPNEWTRIKY